MPWTERCSVHGMSTAFQARRNFFLGFPPFSTRKEKATFWEEPPCEGPSFHIKNGTYRPPSFLRAVRAGRMSVTVST